MTTITRTKPSSHDDNGPMWTIQELSLYLKVPVQTIYRWQKQTPIYGPPAAKIGKNLRWLERDVIAWFIAEQTKRAGERDDVRRDKPTHGLMTAEQLAKLLGVKVDRILSMHYARKLPAPAATEPQLLWDPEEIRTWWFHERGR